MPAISFEQIQGRLRDMKWNIPGIGLRNLHGSEGKGLISVTKMQQIINSAITEWAIELNIERAVWTLDDGSGGEGTLTIDQRKYILPSTISIVTEAKVGYNNDNNFMGFPLILINEPFLDSTLTNVEAFRLAGPGVTEYNFQNQTLPTGTTFPHTILFSTLGADVHGNTPPDTFSTAPFFESLEAQEDVDLFVTNTTQTGFTIDRGAFFSADLPYTINFTFQVIGPNLLQQITPTKGLPQRMFIWKDEFWLDPVPDNAYTLRFYGYYLPPSLSADTDIPSPLTIYHESIFLKCKELVGRELNVVNENQILNQYQRVALQAKKHDLKRHHSVRIVTMDNGYWP